MEAKFKIDAWSLRARSAGLVPCDGPPRRARIHPQFVPTARNRMGIRIAGDKPLRYALFATRPTTDEVT